MKHFNIAIKNQEATYGKKHKYSFPNLLRKTCKTYITISLYVGKWYTRNIVLIYCKTLENGGKAKTKIGYLGSIS